MVNIAFLIHFLIHSFTPSSTPPTHLWWAWASQGSRKLRILLLIVPLFIFLLPSMGALALLSSLAGFLPLRIFDRLLSFPSLKFQHFLKILAPTPLLVLLLLLFSMWFFSSQSSLPHPTPTPTPPPPALHTQVPNLITSRGANARGASGSLHEAGFGY